MGELFLFPGAKERLSREYNDAIEIAEFTLQELQLPEDYLVPLLGRLDNVNAVRYAGNEDPAPRSYVINMGDDMIGEMPEIVLVPNQLAHRAAKIQKAGQAIGLNEMERGAALAQRWTMYEQMFDLISATLAEAETKQPKDPRKYLATLAADLHPDEHLLQRHSRLRSGFAMLALENDVDAGNDAHDRPALFVYELQKVAGITHKTASKAELTTVIARLPDPEQYAGVRDFTSFAEKLGRKIREEAEREWERGPHIEVADEDEDNRVIPFRKKDR